MDVVSLRRRFALAIAYRTDLRVLLLDRDNQPAGWATIAEAIASGAAFTVLVDVAVLAIDSDDPARGPQLYNLADDLTTAGERPVVQESGQPGHLHLFCCVRDGQLHETLAAKARQLGLDVRSTIRPPLAPHRLGFEPRLISPTDPLEALAALEPPFPRRRRGLTARMRELLEKGDVHRRYSSRSEAILALAVAAVNARWTFGEFRAAMEHSPAAVKLHSRPDAERELRRCWSKAIRRVRISPPIADHTGARQVIADIRRAADSLPWPGRGGATDRAVLEVHLSLAMRLGRVEYDYSLRDVADDAGVGLQAARRSHSRLRRSGWLITLEIGRGGTSTRWRIVTPEEVSVRNTYIPRGGVSMYVTTPDTSPGHDAFRWHSVCSRGLGKSTWRVYAVLDAESGARTRDLMSKLRIGRSGVCKHLRRLERLGLSISDGNGMWRRGGADLEEVARRLGTAGIGVRERASHKREREEYRHRARETTRRSAAQSADPHRKLKLAACSRPVNK